MLQTMNTAFVLYIVSTFISLSVAKLCKQYETQKDFDVKRYLGGWYDIQKTNFPGQMDKKCPLATYSPRQEDNKIHVLNQDVKADGHEENTSGIAYYKDENDKSKLTVQLGTSPEANYWVLATDYKTYSLVWACNSYGGMEASITWILAREKTLGDDVIEMLKDKLSALGISNTGFTKTDETDCPW